MISPLRLKENRTDICMPERASSRGGGIQQARSASNIALSVSSLWSDWMSLAAGAAATPAAAALSMVRRRSWPSGYSISGMQGRRWNTLQWVGLHGCRLNTLQKASARSAGQAMAAAPRMPTAAIADAARIDASCLALVGASAPSWRARMYDLATAPLWRDGGLLHEIETGKILREVGVAF